MLDIPALENQVARKNFAICLQPQLMEHMVPLLSGLLVRIITGNPEMCAQPGTLDYSNLDNRNGSHGTLDFVTISCYMLD
jgi:hypothetical protein